MKKKKVCMICAPGGHFEQMKQLKQVWNTYDCFYVTLKNPSTVELKEKHYFTPYPESTNIFLKYTVLLGTSFKSLFILLKERPDVVVTTGGGNVVPMCLLAKIFRKKMVYIESFARFNTASKAGRVLYKYADLFIIQHEELKEFYPNAVYGGSIY